ncbi:STM3941 family protein [uncultured Clostridium sp.]|uniref:STM3941 family protein n=1 Tax=uncultured Clostridium sp. TaxID=59620 RepID=UPI00261F38E3|nr:STM3941 family protein [uncultured Clostridium sp.]
MNTIKFGKKSETTKNTLQLFLGLILVLLFISFRLFIIKSNSNHFYNIYKLLSLICLILSVLSIFFCIKLFVFFRYKCQFQLTDKGIILNGPFIKSKIIYWNNVRYFKEIAIHNGTMPTIAIYLKNSSEYINTLNILDKLSFNYNKKRNYGDINFLGILMNDQYDEILVFLKQYSIEF